MADGYRGFWHFGALGELVQKLCKRLRRASWAWPGHRDCGLDHGTRARGIRNSEFGIQNGEGDVFTTKTRRHQDALNIGENGKRSLTPLVHLPSARLDEGAERGPKYE